MPLFNLRHVGVSTTLQAQLAKFKVVSRQNSSRLCVSLAVEHSLFFSKGLRRTVVDCSESMWPLSLAVNAMTPSFVCMLSSVIVGLRTQTPVPEMIMMINLFSIFLLN